MSRFAKARNLWIGMAMAMAAAGTVPAADDLPKAETILDKYVEVTGGKAAYEKLHSETSTSVMEGMGVKGQVISYHAGPDKLLVEMNIEGMGKMMEGSNGEVAWAVNAMQGPRIKDGAEKSEAILHAQFNGELRWKELYTHAETTGIENVAGKDCYKVVLTPKNGGNPITRWYDKDSGLMLKMRVKANSPMGEIESDSDVSDYRKEGDILMPHKVVQHIATMEMSITVENVKHNADIPKDKFDLPAEIKALQSKGGK
jgi:outer membrane lipoprotein-sorting protein